MFSHRKPFKSAILLLFMTSICRVTSICRSSDYEVGGECCPKCQPGMYVIRNCTELSSTSCSLCAEGTFTSVPNGLKQCLRCSSCPADSGLRLNSSCTRTQDVTCQPRGGYFCVRHRETHCEAAQKHRRCKPGQFIKHSGTAFANTECAGCSAGTFSDGTFTTCQPHRLCDSENPFLQTKGTTSTDAKCGKYSSNVQTAVIVVSVIVVIVGVSAAVIFLMKKKSLKGKTVNAQESTKKGDRKKEETNLMMETA